MSDQSAAAPNHQRNHIDAIRFDHGTLAPRTDVERSEECFVGVDTSGRPVGNIQLFKDGTAGYWREPGEKALHATSWEEAFRRLRAMRA